MIHLRKAALILCFFLPSVCYGGKITVYTTDPLETKDEFKASSTSSASKEKEDPKKNSEESPVKKRVTWAELPESEKQPAKRQKPSAEEVFFSDKERTFETNLAFIQEEIAKAHKQIEPKRLRSAHRKIYSLNYSEDVWKRQAQALKAYRWPSQKSWRDVVAGHLFFPEETFEWEVTPSEEYRLRRIDNLWSYAAAAKSNHAVGKYYLVRMLDKILGSYCDEHPEFFDQRYKETFEDLKKCEDNPDACYVIGVNYEEMPYLSSTHVTERVLRGSNAIDWHSKGRDLKNSYQILCLKKLRPHLYGSVTKNDFLALGRAGFYPAYKEAFDLTATLEEEEPILQEVVATDFKPALFWLGRHYRHAGNKEKGRELYQRAGDEGITWAYISLGTLEVGNVFRYIDVLKEPDKDKNHYAALTQEQIEAGIEWFTRAGEAHHPDGWEHLAELYAKLRRFKRIEKDEFKREYPICLRKGMALGSAKAYRRADRYFKDKPFQHLVEKYGDPPYLLRFSVEKFLNRAY